MNTLPFWLLLIVAGIVLWELIVRWPGDVSEGTETRGVVEGPDRMPGVPTINAATVSRPIPSLTSSTVGRSAGRPIPRTAGTPYDWAADESFGDAAA